MGEQLDIHSLTSDKLYNAIVRVTTTPKYRYNARDIAKVMQDRPFSQDDQIKTWVGYVTRHGGAKHLHCKGFDLEWYQYYLVDVSAVLFCILVATLSVLYVILRRLFCIMKNTYTQVIAVSSTNVQSGVDRKSDPLHMKVQSDFCSEKKAPTTKDAT